jgi:hypothetical protein
MLRVAGWHTPGVARPLSGRNNMLSTCCRRYLSLTCTLLAAVLLTAARPASAAHTCEAAFLLDVPDSFMDFNDWSPPNNELDACGDDVDAIGWGMWFKVVGTGNVLKATTCNGTTDYDSQISIFCGDCDDLICVAGNNDDPECDDTRLSTVQWCSELGRTYFILVHGVGNSMGIFRIDITEGDECDNPTGCQTPTGSCCAADGSCTETTEVDCDGDWTEGESCDPNPCPQPTGACCEGNGSCSVTTEADCDGDWNEGESCEANPCEQPPRGAVTGSCCAEDGSCTETIEDDCQGVWTEDGSCEPNLCEQPSTSAPTGACCADDGSCSETTEADCDGLWAEDVSCETEPCAADEDDVFDFCQRFWYLWFIFPLRMCGLCSILTLGATIAGLVGMKVHYRRRR